MENKSVQSFQAPYAGIWEPKLPDDPDTLWPLIQTSDADMHPGGTADPFGQRPDHCLTCQVRHQILFSGA